MHVDYYQIGKKEKLKNNFDSMRCQKSKPYTVENNVIEHKKLEGEEEISLNSIVSSPAQSLLITACHQDILAIKVSNH